MENEPVSGTNVIERLAKSLSRHSISTGVVSSSPSLSNSAIPANPQIYPKIGKSISAISAPSPGNSLAQSKEEQKIIMLLEKLDQRLTAIESRLSSIELRLAGCGPTAPISGTQGGNQVFSRSDPFFSDI